jgi:hypothetical protein
MARRKGPCPHGIAVGPCEPCRKDQSKARYAAHRDEIGAKLKAHRLAHPDERRMRRAAQLEKERARGRAYRAAHPEKGRAWRAANKDKTRQYARDARRNTKFPQLYGITFDEALAMRDAQDNRCLICLCLMTDGSMSHRRWVPDHYMNADGRKVVRGILCSSCNIGIAHVGDHDPAALRRAATYIEATGRSERGAPEQAEGAQPTEQRPQRQLRLVIS